MSARTLYGGHLPCLRERFAPRDYTHGSAKTICGMHISDNAFVYFRTNEFIFLVGSLSKVI